MNTENTEQIEQENTEQDYNPEEALIRRKEIRAQQSEQTSVIAQQNQIALQCLLSVELSQYIDPQTGRRTDKTLQETATAKMRNLAEAAAHCEQVVY